MRKALAIIALAVVAFIGGASFAYAAVSHPYVKSITGSPSSGWHVKWSNGQSLNTPTRSEEFAECNEEQYPRACKASRRAADHWRVELKRSLHHYK